MDEDKKKDSAADSTSEENADEKEEKDEEKDKDEGEEEEDFDYDKELERRKGGSKYSPLEKATHSLKKTVDEIKRLGGDPGKFFETKGDEKESEDEKKGITADQIRSIIKEEVGSIKSTFSKNEVTTRVSKLGKTDKERELITHLFDTRITRSENLDEDIEDAYLLANKHRMKGIMSELARGKKNTKKTGGGDESQKRESKDRPKMDPKEEAFAKSKGLIWSDAEGRFVSKARQEFQKKQK